MKSDGMGERALKWGLRLLGIALTLGPILIALGTRGWDIKAAVLPTESEIREVEDIISGVLGGDGFSESTMQIEDPLISGSMVSATVHLTSPLNVSMILKEFSGEIYDGDVRIGEINMEEEEVEIPPGGTVTFHLVGEFSGDPPQNPRVCIASIEFDVYGVTITAHPSREEIGGGA